MLKKLFVVSILFFVTSVWAWRPSGPVKIIVSQAVGGSGQEVAIRGIIPIIEQNNPGVSFLIEHHPGINGLTGINYFGQQLPNGQTMSINVVESLTLAAPAAYRSQLTTDLTQWVPVTTVAKSSLVFAVGINSPIKNSTDMVRYLKNNQRVNVGGNGSINLLTHTYLAQQLKLEQPRVQLINYNGPTQLLVDVANQNLDIATIGAPSAVALNNNKIRIIAHTGNDPLPGIESVPPINKLVPGLTLNVTWAIYLPPGTPADIADWYDIFIIRLFHVICKITDFFPGIFFF